MNNHANSSRIFGLDLMRAVAILMVLFGHCLWIFPHSNHFVYQFLQLFGFLGVEIFFVLSGFLIGNILLKLVLKENFTLKTALHFLKRRWFRTLPNYFLVLMINILIAFFVGYEIPQTWRYFLFLQNFNTTMLLFFPESWSLSVEEFAYIFLPILLVIANGFAKKNKATVYITSVLILILASFIAKVYYALNTANISLDQWNISLKSVVLYRIDSIYIGVIASWFYLQYEALWQKLKYSFMLLGIFMFFCLFFGLARLGLLIETQPFLWNVFYLPMVSICMALFLPVLSLWKTEIAIIQKPIEFISKISYSIYLLHYSLILYLIKYFIDTSTYSTGDLFLFTLLYLIIVFLSSWLVYRFFEKPMTDLRDKV